MLYSLFVLLVGIYLGQELNLPSIKKISLSLTKTQQQDQQQQEEQQQQQELVQINYIERFFNYISNKQKD